MNQKEAKALAKPVVDALLKEFPEELHLDKIEVLNRTLHRDVAIRFATPVVTDRDLVKLLGLRVSGCIGAHLEVGIVPYTNNSVYVEILVKP